MVIHGGSAGYWHSIIVMSGFNLALDLYQVFPPSVLSLSEKKEKETTITPNSVKQKL